MVIQPDKLKLVGLEDMNLELEPGKLKSLLKRMLHWLDLEGILRAIELLILPLPLSMMQPIMTMPF